MSNAMFWEDSVSCCSFRPHLPSWKSFSLKRSLRWKSLFLFFFKWYSWWKNEWTPSWGTHRIKEPLPVFALWETDLCDLLLSVCRPRLQQLHDPTVSPLNMCLILIRRAEWGDSWFRLFCMGDKLLEGNRGLNITELWYFLKKKKCFNVLTCCKAPVFSICLFILLNLLDMKQTLFCVAL